MASEHRSYTDRELEVFRETSLTEILRAFGKNTQHTRGGLFYSPFHDEKTPSFHIDEKKHLWCDHGICAPGQKSGGDVIDLVRALKGCTFSEACAFLADFHPNLSIAHNDEIIDLPGQYTTGPAVRVIDSVQDKFTSQFCLDYAEGERHIPRNILNRYCSQVTFHYENGNGSKGYQQSVIGFPNLKGWALRWKSKDPKKGKVSTGQQVSLIGPDGSFLPEEALSGKDGSRKASAVAVFEGFFDFLSWMAMNNRETTGNIDVVVLNTTKNAQRGVLPFITSHDKVVCFLDNDATGTECTKYIEDAVKTASTAEHPIVFLDQRKGYADSNDVNEAWVKIHRKFQMDQFKKKQQEVPTQKQTNSNGPKLH